MRHVVGILLAVVLAAAVFFAGSWGYLRVIVGLSTQGALPAGGGSLIHHTAILEGLGALAGVGLIAGLMIAVPRISALAAGLPGLGLVAWTGLYIFSVRRAVHYIPLKTYSYGMGFEALLFNGVLALVGLAMIIPLFVPSRWRSVTAAPLVYDNEEQAVTVTYPGLQETQTLAEEGGLMSDWAETRPQPRVNPSAGQAPWGPADPGRQ